MGIQNPRNIGGHVKAVVGIIPKSRTATSVNPGTAGDTPGFDRSLNNFPQSMVVHLNAGATSSNPSVATAQAQVFDSPDDTTYTAYVPPPIAGVKQTTCVTAAVDVSAAAGSAELDVDLSGANKFVALKLLQTFTGGTSPAIIAGATMVMGGSSVEPF